MEIETKARKRIDRRDRREYMKQYREAHKEHLAELNRALWEKNKDKINEYRSEKKVCEICGGCYTVRHKATHEKSERHQAAANP